MILREKKYLCPKRDEIGKAEGERKANLEHAKTMKALGLDTDIITQVTGLSAEEIEQL